MVARTLRGALPELVATIPEWSSVDDNFNVAPSTDVPIIYGAAERFTGVGHRVFQTVHWGFVASWKKSFTERPQPFNARIESVATNGMFRFAFQHRRAIIPAVGYYEWRVMSDGSKVPYFITSPKRGLAMAAIFEDWIDPALPADHPEKIRRSASIITRQAIGPAAGLHDRMPVILAPQVYDTWLGGTLGSPQEALELLLISSAKTAAALEFWPVSPRVGNVRNNDIALMAPL